MELNIDRIASVANKLVKISTELPSNPTPKKIGGYLTIGTNRLQEIFSIQIGTIEDLTKISQYRNFSKEKAYRLQADWFRDPFSLSSWQTRDESMKRYGGAVLLQPHGPVVNGTHHIISFSGLKEIVDEAVSLTLGYDLGLTNEELIEKIVKISNNHAFPEMLKRYKLVA